MSDIPSIDLTDLVKIAEEGKVSELKSCEVTSDGEYLFTAVIGHGDMFSKEHAKINAEQIALDSNIAGGKDPAEFASDPYPNLTKAREARKLKQETVTA